MTIKRATKALPKPDPSAGARDVDDDFDDEHAETKAVVPHVKGSALVVGGVAYEIAAIVTRSVLRQIPGIPFFIEIESAIYEAPPLEGSSKMAPPDIMDVVNLETGECQVVICNTVLHLELDRKYPNAGYVGRKFAMCGYMAGRETNDYRVYNIVELNAKA